MNLSANKLIRKAKLARLASGAAPRVLDICAGCGGLSLGLHKAGFELSAHIELDPEAACSYSINFDKDKAQGEAWSKPRDMVESSAQELAGDLGLGKSSEAFDVLAAGLPCQAFARIGRSKLRSVTGHDDAFQRDPRASLYRRFLEYVEDTQPLVILLENVPDILNFGGHNVPEEICENLETRGYRAAYTILNSSYYGVPQVRERLFIVALADVLGQEPEFPEPTHHFFLPRGYEGSRRVALKHVDRSTGRFREIHVPDSALPPAIGTKEALGDLPAIQEHLSDPSVIRRRKLAETLPYRLALEAASDYSRLMRQWPGFESDRESNAHLVRLTTRDYPIFAAMSPGDDYPRAREIAERRYSKAVEAHRRKNGRADASIAEKLRKELVPPYDPSKFPNKWWKLDPDKPSRTLTAHMGKDTYSHIHYDDAQSRTVSVREAARLQSFPDGFVFDGAMNAAFRQIGNAVPPLLAFAVANSLWNQLAQAAARSKNTGGTQAA